MERNLASAAVLAALVALAPSARLQAQTALEDVELVSTNAGNSGRFGTAVAAEGDRMVVGAPESGGVAQGLVEVFERDVNGAWLSQAALSPTSPQFLGRFGFSVALSGDVVAGSYSTVQRIDVFERDLLGAYPLLQSILPPDVSFVNFGRSIAMEGDRLVVATSGSGGFGFGPGAVSVYERSGSGTFNFVTSVFVPASSITTVAQSFGTSSALDGDTVAVGDPRAVVSGQNGAGRVVIFERNSATGVWSATQTLIAPTTVGGEYFGWAVSLDGDRLTVGSPGASNSAGRVDVYERGGGSFVHQDALFESPPVLNNGFGSSLSLRGDRLAVGVPGDDAAAAGAGAIELFERTSGGAWTANVRFGRENAGTNDGLGNGSQPIALSEERLIVGVPTLERFRGGVEDFELGTLYHGASTISVAAGGAQDLLLRAGEARGGDAYVMLGSMTGTSPGLAVAPGVELPLVFDAYTNLGLSFSTPAQPGFGVLDANGRANAAFTIHVGTNASFAGLFVHHAYVTIDLVSFEVGASNAVRVDLVL